jgi:hypothetical protein
MSELIRRARNSDLQLPLTGLDGETSCFGADRTGVGKLIQLIDFEVDSGTARGVGSTGYSRPIPPWESAVEVAEGFCMVGGEYPGTAQYRLRDDQLGDLSKYLPGLKPSGLATKSWLAQPGRYLRQPADFDVSTYRKTLPEPPVGAYFYDAVAGRFHSYAVSLSMVQYALEPDVVPIVFPLHEVETRITFNDPAHPNCSGAVSPTVECLDVPRWSGVVCHERTCTPDPGAFAEYAGYLFITEREQVYMPAVFEMTGCVSFLTKGRAAADGWLTADEKSCKTANWNPAAPNDEGLPRGDWCAVTNSPATATCHDAVRFHERATYAATKIRGATGPASVPQICPFG